MLVVSANDQTVRDRSPVHGLRGFVCFRESRFVTCADKPVSFQRRTATSYAILDQFFVSLPWLEAPPVSSVHSTVSPKSATQSSPFDTTSATLPMN